MTLELTQAQRQAVQRGEMVHINVSEFGELVVLQAAAYKEILALERDKAAWAKVARETAERWAQENPFS